MSFKKAGIYVPNPNTNRGTSTKLSAHKDKVIYTNGRAVIIRDLNNPDLTTAYYGHVQNTTVARFSPSGYYAASADVSGTVRVWDTVGEDQTLKGEFKVISGRINDLDWDGDSKRIIAVGDGREKFGHAFMMDTGSSTGEIIGHSKAVNAVSIRHQRPFRAATAADDALIVFHQGPPYKYDKTIKTHTKFVQDVRYSPSGSHFASVGSDSKVLLYDGMTGETVSELVDSPHKGSVMACTWSSDSLSLATSSADCTVKLWDIETKKAVTTWSLGSGVNHQQVGNVYSGDNIVSLSMSGDLNVFDRRTPTPARIIHGLQKAITAATPSSPGTFIAGAADGRIASFSTDTRDATAITGAGHSNFVSALGTSPNGTVYSVGYDDHLRELELNSNAFTGAALTTASQPKSLVVSKDSTVFIAEGSSVEVVKSNQKIFTLPTKFLATSVASINDLVAVGGDDHKVHFFSWDGQTLKEAGLLEGNKGVISALAFSPDAALLASGDSSGRIALFDSKEKKLITSRWSFHSATVNSLAFTSDSKHCASGSLDTHVYVWSVAKPMKNIAIKNANAGGVNAVFWLDEANGKTGTLASAGADATIQAWKVTFH